MSTAARDERDGALAIEAVDEKIDSSHLEQAEGDKHEDKTSSDAMMAEEAEHKMPLFQALKVYKSAILWSMAISLVIVMDGYDTGRKWIMPSRLSNVADYAISLVESCGPSTLSTEVWGTSIERGLPIDTHLADCSGGSSDSRQHHVGYQRAQQRVAH